MDPLLPKLGMPDPPPDFYTSVRGLAGENLKRYIAKFFPGHDPQKLLDAVWAMADERFARGVPCKPGLKELLAYLEEKGLPRIVASSSPRNMIEMNLQTTGVARYFHDVVCGTDVARSKPDPAIFLEAARRLDLDPRACLVLEDSFNGVRAGAAAGAVTVMVPDLAQPTEEIQKLYTRCCKDLLKCWPCSKAASFERPPAQPAGQIVGGFPAAVVLKQTICSFFPEPLDQLRKTGILSLLR